VAGLGETEVAEFEGRAVRSHKHIVELQVEMGDPTLVDFSQGLEDLLECVSNE